MKERQINIRVSAEELDRIVSRAQAEGVTVSKLVRGIVMDALNVSDVTATSARSGAVLLPLAGSLRIALETLSRRLGVTAAEIALRAVDAGIGAVAADVADVERRRAEAAGSQRNMGGEEITPGTRTLK